MNCGGRGGPAGENVPTLFAALSTNQIDPLGPSVIPTGTLPAVGVTSSVSPEPSLAMLPISLFPSSVNQIRLVAFIKSPIRDVVDGRVNCLNVPVVETRPILL